jgi:threonine synthase
MDHQTFLSHLQCSACGSRHDAGEIQTVCRSCGAALLARYDLDAARTAVDRSVIAARPGTMWRYRELLPVGDPASIVSLGEGWTPVLPMTKEGAAAGLGQLFLKEEGVNPTGSFKARGLSMAVSRAKELGVTDACIPTAGNAGGALAAYGAAAGIGCHVFLPADTPRVNIQEVKFFGADCRAVDGLISDAAKAMNEARKGTAWFDMSTMKEPYRLEGKKTMGYELAEQFAWLLPDVILYPTGGGTGLIGMWKAFQEMEQLGWIDGPRPRMVSVQMTGCAPVVKAFGTRAAKSEFWEGAATAASGLRVPKAFADHLILEALYESAGTAVAVTDDDALRAMVRVARTEGVLLCPEGAAAVAALPALTASGFLRGPEKVVVFNTGSGYKYAEILERGAGGEY